MSNQLYFDPYTSIESNLIHLKEVDTTDTDAYDFSDYNTWLMFSKSGKITSSPEVLAKIEILIPYHNSESLEDLILNLVKYQALPINFSINITIVASGCDKSHIAYAKDIAGKYNSSRSSIRLIIQPEAGKPLALNTGIEAINNNFIIQLVDDIVLSKNAIALLWLGLLSNPEFGAAVLVGQPGNLNKSGLLHEVQRIHHDLFYKNDQYALVGRAFAFRKDFVLSQGGFPQKVMSEDFWLEMHVREYTRGFIIINRAHVIYDKPNTWLDYFRQLDRFDGSFKQLSRVYPELFRKHYGFIKNSFLSMLGLSSMFSFSTYLKGKYSLTAKIVYVFVILYQLYYLGLKNSLVKVNSAKFKREKSTILSKG